MKRLAVLISVTFLSGACHGREHVTLPMVAPSPVLSARPDPSRSAPRLIAGTALSIGQSVRAQVEIEAPHCYENWDAGARCRQFDLAVPTSGMLRVEFEWPSMNRLLDPDLFFVNPNGDWQWLGDGPTPRSATISVNGGADYHIVVLSYLTTAQDFTLATKLQ